MKIVIQGPQGSGKSTAAQNIAFAYKPDAVLYIDKLSYFEIKSHLRFCKKIKAKPLYILDDLTKVNYEAARLFFIEFKKNNPDDEIDTIFITQSELL